MFGIDLGISISSVCCITKEGKLLDYSVLFGKEDKAEGDWTRVCRMSDYIVISINDICRGMAGIVVDAVATIEEPIYSFRTRNPKSHLTLTRLYTLVRHKLEKRGFNIYSVNPITVKSTARRLAFRDKKLKSKYIKSRALTKDGMVRAFKRVNGVEPPYPTKLGRETIADSYFIAQSGYDLMRLGINDPSRLYNNST